MAPGPFPFYLNAKERDCRSKDLWYMVSTKAARHKDLDRKNRDDENLIICTGRLATEISENKLLKALRCPCAVCASQNYSEDDDGRIAKAIRKDTRRFTLLALLARCGCIHAARFLDHQNLHDVSEVCVKLRERDDLRRDMFSPFLRLELSCSHVPAHALADDNSRLRCLEHDFCKLLQSKAWLFRFPYFEESESVSTFSDRHCLPFFDSSRREGGTSNRPEREYVRFTIDKDYCSPDLAVCIPPLKRVWC